MATDTDAFTDVRDSIDPKTRSKADYGVSARRKATLSNYEAPLPTLAAHGVSVPHRDFSPEDEREVVQTLVDGDQRVHQHQRVLESTDTEFGNFKSSEDIEWLVVDLDPDAETVVLTVIGDWGKRRTVETDDLFEDYELQTVDTPQGEMPVFDY